MVTIKNMKQNTTTRGGRRPGAGRPPLPEGKRKVFKPLELESTVIDLIRVTKPTSQSYSEYIRSLILRT
jgi:hypothetical protein